MVRDNQETKHKIIRAVGDLLAEQGFQGVGVNSVARKAGVDKVLIYRYFGGLPQLIRAYAADPDFWPDERDLIRAGQADQTEPDLAGTARAVLTGHLRELRRRPLTQEIMRWELAVRNELTDELAAAREATADNFVESWSDGRDRVDLADLMAVGAIIHAGISFLVLRAKTADVYMGVDLTSEAGWGRIEKAIGQLVEGYFSRSAGVSDNEEES